MQRIRGFAQASVRRACGFAGLGIVSLMIGFSYDPVLAARAGGLFTSILSLYLIYRGYRAPSHPFKRTEVWIMLDQPRGLSEEAAQRVIGSALHDSYLEHAAFTGSIALLLWLAAVVLWLTL